MDEAGKLRVAIVGAGASGIMAAIKLREIGVTDVVLFEKADDLGGTWRDNTYPGLACDVPSHLYRYSFAPNPDWSLRYAPGAEIQDYLRRVATTHGINQLIQYSSEVTEATYRDRRWLIQTTRGDRGAFDVVVTATGVLHNPVYPDIEGLKEFKGAAFHTARWDHGVPLKGKRVGIIGTGSTAAQILPAIVDDVEAVSLFQRTAQWIMPQPNAAISEEKRAGYRANPTLMEAKYQELAQVFNGTFCAALAGENEEVYQAMAKACRDNLDRVVDPALRAQLTPSYKMGCKRLIVSDRFYAAIQQPNAMLVSAKISHVEAGGVRTIDGRLHELDCIVLATGFDPHRLFRPLMVKGRAGKTLGEAWADGNIAYRAIAVPDFPNFFMLGGPHSPIGNFSFLMTVERQLGYILQLVRLLQSGSAREISPRSDSTQTFNAALREKAARSIWASGCRSWYLDKGGNVASYPWSFEKFEHDMRTPVLEDYELAHASG
jgi:cyclohexanone monooxygenase